MNSRLNSRRVVAVLLAGGLSAAACSSGGSSAVQIGIKQIALSLAFSEEELKVPVEPEIIVRVVPAQEPITVQDLQRFERVPDAPPPPPPPVEDPCPAARPDAVPKEAVTRFVNSPPEPGRFTRFNSGTIEVVGGAIPLTFPYPAVTTWDIVHLEPDESVEGVEFDVVKNLSDSVTVIDRLRLTEDDIDLVRRTTVTGDEVNEFNPTPPIRWYGFGVEGTTWSEGGVDLSNQKALVIDGRIDVRELVDVCGELIDTYRVEIKETEVDLLTGQTSQSTEPTVLNIATQHGGLVVREEVHRTYTQEVDGSVLTLQYDYVSTVSSIEPQPIPKDE